MVQSGQRLTHQLRPSAAPSSEPDESTPTRRARPAGVLGAEVWVKLVAPTCRLARAHESRRAGISDHDDQADLPRQVKARRRRNDLGAAV